MLGPPPELELRGEPGLDYYRNMCERLQEMQEVARQVLIEAGADRSEHMACRGENLAPGDQGILS